jgi:hypothetical protein
MNLNVVSFPFDCVLAFFRHTCKQLFPTHYWQLGIVLPTSYFRKLSYLTANIDFYTKVHFGHKIIGSTLRALPAVTHQLQMY